jgi:hypothetical protein
VVIALATCRGGSTRSSQAARIICRTDASRAAFIEHCYQEAFAIIEESKPVVLALAQALIDHPERTLNAAEIDAVIADVGTRGAGSRASPPCRMAAYPRKRRERTPPLTR